MGLISPNNSNEILYGTSGDVRNEINAYGSPIGAGHYIDETEVPGTAIIRGLERATRLINAYLEVVYADQIPLTAVSAVPVLLDDIASDLATFYVWRANVARLAPMPEHKRQQYYLDHVGGGGIGAERGTLLKISRRELQLPEFTSAYADEVATTRNPDRPPIFDLDDERGQQVSPNLIDDIINDKDK